MSFFSACSKKPAQKYNSHLFSHFATTHPFCRYEKHVPDSAGGSKKLGAKGAFEEYYVELIDQINCLNLVRQLLRLSYG